MDEKMKDNMLNDDELEKVAGGSDNIVIDWGEQ